MMMIHNRLGADAMNKLTEQDLIDAARVVEDCRTLNGLQFAGNHYKVSQFQRAPILLEQVLNELVLVRAELAAIKGEQRPLPRHVFSMLVNELRDVPAIGCKRALIIGVLNRHGVTAEQVK